MSVFVQRRYYLLGMVTLQLLLGSVNPSQAGDRVNVRGMGMGRTSVVIAYGLDAVSVNPANLSRTGSEVMTLSVLPIGAYITSDFLTYDLYSKYLKKGVTLSTLPDAAKQEILGVFGGPKGSTKADATARFFGITLRIDSTKSVAFTVDYGLVAGGEFPREYARLLLYGNSPGSSFNIDGVAAEAYWHRTYEVSYGTALPAPEFLRSLSAGVGIKLVQGYGYYSINKLSSLLTTNSEGTISGNVSMLARRVNTDGVADPLQDLFQTPAGYGVGFDVGVLAGLMDNVTFGFSVTDIGSISWTKDIEELSMDSTITTTDPNVLTNVRSLANTTQGGRRNIGQFSSRMPGLMRFGLAAQVDGIVGQNFPGELLVALEYMQGLGASAPLREQPRISLGFEYKPTKWLPIRAGFSIGGSSNSHTSFGIGVNLRSVDLDLATEDVSWLFSGKEFSTGSVGVAARIRIH